MNDLPAARMPELSETLARAARLIKSYRHLTAAPVHGLESALVPLLFQLEQGPRRLTELAECVHSDVSTISRQVSSLTRLGLVAKQPDPHDGRALQLTLTDLGRDALAKVRELREQNFALFLADWTPDEVADFHHHLERLAHDVEQRYAELLAERSGRAPHDGAA